MSTGATVVINHHVKDEKVLVYEAWLEKISRAAKESSGLLDWQIVKPIANLTTTYTILLRFESEELLKKWMGSAERKTYIEEVKPYLVDGDDFYTGSGLDFLFLPPT